VIAEKLEALTALGLLNSRMKDYDLALLSRMYPFDGETLAQAIVATFRHRGTTVEADPIGLTRAYWDEPARVLQWRAFVRRSVGETEDELMRLVEEIRPFLLPVLSKLGSLRRECLDFLIPVNEPHLKLTIRDWAIHSNRGRPPSALGPWCA